MRSFITFLLLGFGSLGITAATPKPADANWFRGYGPGYGVGYGVYQPYSSYYYSPYVAPTYIAPTYVAPVYTSNYFAAPAPYYSGYQSYYYSPAYTPYAYYGNWSGYYAPNGFWYFR